ncbi:rRNA biogenesis protein [Podosphaera aphanis]|nr:rRNA biogenesis protein [Podosphaera aphanis]
MTPSIDTKKKRKRINDHDEDAVFPRGGASILTPLEHKQIQIQATQDVLFEQHGDKVTAGNSDNDGDKSVKRRKKSLNSNGKAKPKISVDAEDRSIKIESLNFKVSEINDHDIALSLPNNLTGYVPITSISDKITHKIESIAALSEDESDAENCNEVVLEKIFKIGQYLRAYVVSTRDEPSNSTAIKSKKRIELSLRPQQTNNSLNPQNITPHMTLMASVTSVEDHGVIMDLGLQNSTIRGFMSSNELGADIKLNEIEEGAVYLCIVTGLSSNGKIIKLSADSKKIGNIKKSSYLTEASNVDVFLPGTAVEVLVSEISTWGLVGKIMGMVDVTADLTHSGVGATEKDLERKYKVGTKIKGRVICTFPEVDPPKLGISLLDHVLCFERKRSLKNGESRDPLDILPLSSVIERVIVKRVQPNIGLIGDVGVKGIPAFIHISRVRDGKIENLSENSGSYKLGSEHRGRVIGYSFLDGVYMVSFQPSIIEQPFLRIEDLKIGSIVQGKVEKLLIQATGVTGLLVNLADGISGLVPLTHMSDIKLQHPERKFKEGTSVKARVLSTDISKRQIRLTLKKTLVNSDAQQFLNYEDIKPHMQSPGTIVNIVSKGAVLQFYGNVRGFLPVAEMSETYIQDPSQHFQVGQVLNVHVLSIVPEEQRMIVTCKDPASFSLAKKSAIQNLNVGSIVKVTVMEKSEQGIQVALESSELRALLPVGQLTDGSHSKNMSLLKKIHVGGNLVDLVVLEKDENKQLVVLSNKPSLVKCAKENTLLTRFEDVRLNSVVHGFIRNITSSGVFVQFGGRLTGLLPKSKLPEDIISCPDFGMRKLQSVRVKIVSVDQFQQRFQLSMIDLDNNASTAKPILATGLISPEVLNPVDKSINTLDDFTLGRLTKARVTSVKDTQVNVQLADNIQGRIDVSQVFDSWESIEDRKKPLGIFSTKQIIDVRILGTHDARNHCFLPITHRGGKTSVLELSAKPSDQTDFPLDLLTLDRVKVKSTWIAFVNNISNDCLWVNLSPNVRGRIAALDVSDDVSLLRNLSSNFPIGSAIRVRVTSVDIAGNRLDLCARSKTSDPLTHENISKGMVIPGRVIKADKSHILVQIGDGVVGQIHLTDLADDYSEAKPTNFSKNDFIKVCICDIDKSNKKIRLSARPSRVLNSSLVIQDPDISSVEQLQVNDVVRGFVKNISDQGIFVSISGNLVAYARVSDLSDSYIKDWKSQFEIDQLVKAKVISINPTLNQIQICLKSSILDKDYVAPISFADLKVGQIVTGKIRKVEDYGVFILVDGSDKISGLCHKSELADSRVHDVKKLYEEGDTVKAVVLKLEPELKRVNFGLKTSYLDAKIDSDDDLDNESGSDNDELDVIEDSKVKDFDSEGDISSDEDEGGVALSVAGSISSTEVAVEKISGIKNSKSAIALNAGGFDWSATLLDQPDASNDISELSDDENSCNRKKKKRKNTGIIIDRTGDLDAAEPQSVVDFERLLLGQPDSSELWIKYMAFELQLGELEKARAVAERAIKTINIREETEKLNIWIALLNLEHAYGSDETVQEVFQRACQYNDPQEIHERLISICIKSGKLDKADELFQATVKKFSQTPAVWSNYAHFLFVVLSSPDRGRALLQRATQALPPHTHLNLTLKFAALEFNSTSGSPERGRTIFEGLLSTFPKRLDIWSQLLDLEVKQGDPDIIREVFERVTKSRALKPKTAKSWFKKWSEWEETHGDKKSRERVKAKAQEWVKMAAS